MNDIDESEKNWIGPLIFTVTLIAIAVFFIWFL
jgi:hypothetical protein